MRKKLIFPLLFLYLWSCCLAACQQQASRQEAVATAEETGYQVIAIKDGDTIEILKDGKPLRIRLYGIDAPEKNQDFGSRARQFTSDLVFGKLVDLEIKDTDRYGRTVGIIYLADGRSLNEELVREGFAWHYKAYSKDPALAVLEEAARQAKRGLWAGPTPIAPWDFRKGRRTKSQQAPSANTRAAKQDAEPEKAGRATGSAYLCDSKTASTFHLNQDCRQLKNCKAAIKALSYQAARKLGRKACKVCAD
jgi:micrococcal nuclease